MAVAYPRRRQARGAVGVGEFDVEMFLDEDGEAVFEQLVIDCPHCGRRHRPYASPLMRRLELDGGWRWVGLDHREPYWRVLVLCPHARRALLFTMYVPQ
jgi:hypothetical protein